MDVQSRTVSIKRMRTIQIPQSNIGDNLGHELRSSHLYGNYNGFCRLKNLPPFNGYLKKN
jgi:hypothetical protein